MTTAGLGGNEGVGANVVVVTAAPGDAAAIATLHAASWRSAYRGILPDHFLDGPIDDNRRELWQHRMSQAAPPTVLKATVDGRLTGFACVFAHADPAWGALLDNLHVSPEAKRHGIGARLLRAALDWVRGEGSDRGLHLWVFEANAGARAFYERQGGRQAGHRTIEIIPGTHVPEIRYHWDL